MEIKRDLFTKIQPLTAMNKLSKPQSKINNKIETYNPQSTENQWMINIWNYSPNEVGRKSNINSVSSILNSCHLPNWDLISTKGMNVLPYDELIIQLKAVAAKTALAVQTGQSTSYEEIEANQMQMNKLLTQYLSSVSPDRKALHKQAMQAIKKFESGEKEILIPLGEQTLVNYLTKMDVLIKDTDKVIPLSNGGFANPIINSLGGYDYDVKVGGQTLLENSNGRWHDGETPAEEQKMKEFYQLYWSFVDEAKNDLKQ